MELPEKVPEVGLYYHYKHDPNGSVENYAYEFLGVGFHTETENRFASLIFRFLIRVLLRLTGIDLRQDRWYANYRPLYQSSVYTASKKLGVACVDSRPLEMWMGDVTKDSKTFKRFQKITDPATISQLESVRSEMYDSRGRSSRLSKLFDP